MLVFRTVGACMLALCGVLSAVNLNARASASLSQIEAWIRLLHLVKTQIECFSVPMPEILKRLDVSLLRSCGYSGKTPPRSLGELVGGCDIRDAECMSVMDSFAGEFGGGYRDEQVKRCDYFIALLDRRRDAVSAQLPSKKKLNATLCVTGALAIVILFL